MALRAAAKKVAYLGRSGTRSMGGHGDGGVPSVTAEARWAPFFPLAPEPTAEKAKKSLNKELFGFMLLGPLGAGFMFYDYIWGLEEEHDVVIPPYPWMRMRRRPGMPWGEDGLFEKHPKVAKEWPPADGIPEAVHH